MNIAVSLCFGDLLIGEMLLEHSSLDSERATACCLPLFLFVLWSRPVEYCTGSALLQRPEDSQSTDPAGNPPFVVASSNGCKPAACHLSLGFDMIPMEYRYL